MIERYLDGLIINKDNIIEDVGKQVLFGGKISYLDKYKEILIKYDIIYLNICKILKNSNYKFLYDIDEMIIRLNSKPIIVIDDDTRNYFFNILSKFSINYLTHIMELNGDNIIYVNTDKFYYKDKNLILPELHLSFTKSKIDYFYLIRGITTIIYQNNQFYYKGFRKTFDGNEIKKVILHNVRKDKLNNLLDG